MTTTDIFSASSRTVLEYHADIYPDDDNEDLTIWPVRHDRHICFTASRVSVTVAGESSRVFTDLTVEVSGPRVSRPTVIGDITYSASDTPLNEAPEFLIKVLRTILPTSAHHLLGKR